MNIALIILLVFGLSFTVFFFTVKTTNSSCGGAIWKIFKYQTIRFTFKNSIDRSN
jgi:hypothetical protein